MNFDEIVEGLEEAEKRMLQAEDLDLNEDILAAGKDVRDYKELLNKKVDSFHKVLMNMEAQKAIHLEYKASHAKRAETYANDAKRLSEWITMVMDKYGLDLLKGDEMQIKVQKRTTFAAEKDVEITPRLAFILNAKYPGLVKTAHTFDRQKLKKIY